jgi:ribosomal protein S18 acetylase RimI-like enzyme
VRTICCETGYLGDPIEPIYADRRSFADLFTSYYTDAEPESCLVVEVDGQVVGYLLGCLDSSKAWSLERIALRHVLTRAVVARPGTAAFYWRGVYDALADGLLGRARQRPDPALFPGHTHFNVLPAARSLPVVPALYRTFFKLAKERGCRGLYGEVFVENPRAMAMNKALGFTPSGEPWPIPGMRSPDGKRMHVQLLQRAL